MIPCVSYDAHPVREYDSVDYDKSDLLSGILRTDRKIESIIVTYYTKEIFLTYNAAKLPSHRIYVKVSDLEDARAYSKGFGSETRSIGEEEFDDEFSKTRTFGIKDIDEVMRYVTNLVREFMKRG